MANDHIIRAKVMDYAFDSKNALQYCPGWDVVFNITQGTVNIPATGYSIGFVRQLLWLRTPTGRWIFQFDRANSSSTRDRLFFCKECGQPFNKLNELGTHTNENEGRCNRTKKQIVETLAEDEDAAEELAIQEQLAKEAEDRPPTKAQQRKSNEEVKAEMLAKINEHQAQKHHVGA